MFRVENHENSSLESNPKTCSKWKEKGSPKLQGPSGDKLAVSYQQFTRIYDKSLLDEMHDLSGKLPTSRVSWQEVGGGPRYRPPAQAFNEVPCVSFECE